jgi:3-methyladenine DNA glycosylase AlkD
MKVGETMTLSEIRQILKNRTDKKVKLSTQRIVPSVEKIYGVKVSVINEIVKKIQRADFELVENLWKNNVLEERILAAKILGRICRKNPGKTLNLVKKFSKDISDWAVCDTLATQGIRRIAKIKQKEIFELSDELIKSKNFWQRRFGLVLLVNFAKDRNLRKEIERILKKVEGNKEYYVKKAVIWLKKSLE